MISPKNTLLVVLALSTLGCGALAWRQYQELVKLRAAALNPQERADWQKRLWASEKQRAALEAQVAAHESGPAETDPAGPPAPGPRPGFRNGRANFAALMDNPEIQRLVATQQKAALDARYAALFKSLNLTPQQLDQFKNFLVEKSTAMMDVLSAARAQGINPRTDPAGFRQLVTSAQTEIDDNIRSTLGDAVFSQYQQYEQTLPQRALLSQLDQRLSYSSTPLTGDQSNQLMQILAATATVPPSNNGPRAFIGAAGAVLGTGGAMAGPHATITDATVSQAAGVLAGPQVDALKQIQQEQQSQAALAAAFRAQMQRNLGGTPAGGTVPAPAPRPPTGG